MRSWKGHSTSWHQLPHLSNGSQEQQCLSHSLRAVRVRGRAPGTPSHQQTALRHLRPQELFMQVPYLILSLKRGPKLDQRNRTQGWRLGHCPGSGGDRCPPAHPGVCHVGLFIPHRAPTTCQPLTGHWGSGREQIPAVPTDPRGCLDGLGPEKSRGTPSSPARVSLEGGTALAQSRWRFHRENESTVTVS